MAITADLASLAAIATNNTIVQRSFTVHRTLPEAVVIRYPLSAGNDGLSCPAFIMYCHPP
jgi:hypothetical protein